MNTILTDDEIVAIARNVLEQKTEDDKPAAWQLAEGVARAVEAVVLDKLERQEPVAWMREGWGPDCGPYVEFYRDDEMDVLRERKDFIALYTHPAPQQADRQRVPEGWIGVVQAARDVLSDAEDHLAKPHSTAVQVALMQLDAMLTAAPEAPTQGEQAAEPVRDEREPSPTAGMTLGQRILHVGGRTNAAGYVEFGSVQAVDALVRHVLRDLPDAPPAQASAVDERAAFEEWWKSERRLKSDSVAQAWEAFQARAALSQKGGDA